MDVASKSLSFWTGSFVFWVFTNDALDFSLPTGALHVTIACGGLFDVGGSYNFELSKFETAAPASVPVPVPGASAGGLALLGGLAMKRRRDSIA